MLLLGATVALVPARAEISRRDIVAVVNRCLTEDDAEPVIQAVQTFVGGKFTASQPPEARLPDGKVPLMPNTRNWLLRETGRHLREHAAALGEGLPPVGAFAAPHRLGPLLGGMLPAWHEKARLDMLRPLLPHLTREWMDQAVTCGAVDFYHAARLAGGEINTLLAGYERAEDEAGLMLLGSALAATPGPAREVRAEDFTPGTLVALLAGACTNPSCRDDRAVELALACAPWTLRHEGMLEKLENQVGDRNFLPLVRVIREFLLGNPAQAARLAEAAPQWLRSEANRILTRFTPRDARAKPVDHEALAKAMDTAQLQFTLKALVSHEEGVEKVQQAMPYLREYLERREVASDRWLYLDSGAVRKAAFEWWKSDRENDARELLLGAYLIDKCSEPRVSPPDFADLLAHLLGNTGLQVALDRQIETWDAARFRHHLTHLRWHAGETDKVPWMLHSERRKPVWKAVEALCGTPDEALAAFRAMPVVIGMNLQTQLLLTGNEAAADDPPPPLESTFAARGPSVRAETKPTGHADPKGTVFSVYDGMAAARDLLQAGDREAARRLFHDIRTRILLEPAQAGFPAGTSGLLVMVDGLADIPCGYSHRDAKLADAEMALALIACWDMDDPVFMDHLTRSVRNNTDTYRWHPYHDALALHLLRHGAYCEAKLVMLDQLATQVNSETVRSPKSRDLCLLAWADGLAEAQAGRADNATLRIMACVKLSPEWPEPARQILRALANIPNPAAVGAVKQAIGDYWKAQRAARPDDAPTRKAEARWLETLEAF